MTSDERWDLNLRFVEQQARGSAAGFKLTFEDLTAFAARVHQVIDGLFEADPASVRPSAWDRV